MAIIANEDRNRYFETIKPYKSAIYSMLKNEDNERRLLKKEKSGTGLRRLILAEEMVSLAANYIILNGISQSMLNIRNEEFLNEGRKSIYKAIIYLEEVVSPLVDAPFSEYADRLAEIDTIDTQKRYMLIKKMGLALQLLKNAYGDKTKWKWIFVELEGRFAVVAKNIINLKSALANKDPLSWDYEPTMYHLRLIKKLFLRAADRYREKYELSTGRTDDFKMGIQFLYALRRIHSLLGEREAAEMLKKKADTWESKLEMDRKKQEEAALKRILSG